TLPILPSPSFFSPTLPPPISTLFPYTTLFRSVRLHDLQPRSKRLQALPSAFDRRFVPVDRQHLPVRRSSIENRSRMPTRSQRRKIGRHTSELQSLRHLVCRLLLEKKKQKRQKL